MVETDEDGGSDRSSVLERADYYAVEGNDVVPEAMPAAEAYSRSERDPTKPPPWRGVAWGEEASSGNGSDAVLRTTCRLVHGARIEHMAWPNPASSMGWIAQVRITPESEPARTLRFVTGLGEAVSWMLPDHGSADAAIEAIRRLMISVIVHLDASSSIRWRDECGAIVDAEDPSVRAEASLACAYADPPRIDDMALVIHRTPWSPMRVLDSERMADLLDDEMRTRGGLDRAPTRVVVASSNDGHQITISNVQGFVDVPDALERLKAMSKA
jgi:hypothetical protein